MLHTFHYPITLPSVYWTPVLIHALLMGGVVSLGVKPGSGGSTESKCGGKETQLQAVLLSLIPFGLAAAATLLIGHSSEVCIRCFNCFHMQFTTEQCCFTRGCILASGSCVPLGFLCFHLTLRTPNAISNVVVSRLVLLHALTMLTRSQASGGCTSGCRCL